MLPALSKTGSIASAILGTTAGRVSSLTQDYTPKSLFSRGVGAVKSELSGQFPEIVSGLMAASNFISDIKSKLGRDSNNSSSDKDLRDLTEDIEENTDESDTVLEALYEVADETLQQVTRTNDLLKLAVLELGTLRAITAKVWGVGNKEVALERQNLRATLRAEGKAKSAFNAERFSQQKSDSKFIRPEDVPNPSNSNPKKDSIFDSVFMGEFLGDISAKILGGIGPILTKLLSVATGLMSGPVGVAAGSLAVGGGVGYFGLQALSDYIDKVTGDTDVIGKFLMNVVDSIENTISYFTSGELLKDINSKIEDTKNYFKDGEFKNDIVTFFKTTFDTLQNSIVSYARSLLRNIVESIPGISAVLPESVKQFIYNNDTQNSNVSTNSSANISNNGEANILNPIQTTSNLSDTLIENTREYNTQSDYKESILRTGNSQNNVNNMVSNKVNTTNYISNSMITRNPEGFGNLYSSKSII